MSCLSAGSAGEERSCVADATGTSAGGVAKQVGRVDAAVEEPVGEDAEGRAWGVELVRMHEELPPEHPDVPTRLRARSSRHDEAGIVALADLDGKAAYDGTARLRERPRLGRVGRFHFHDEPI